MKNNGPYIIHKGNITVPAGYIEIPSDNVTFYLAKSKYEFLVKDIYVKHCGFKAKTLVNAITGKISFKYNTVIYKKNYLFTP